MLAEPASIAQNKRIAPVVVVPRENLDEHTDIPGSLNMSKHKKISEQPQLFLVLVGVHHHDLRETYTTTKHSNRSRQPSAYP